mgnify:CR=1 FL=1
MASVRPTSRQAKVVGRPIDCLPDVLTCTRVCQETLHSSMLPALACVKQDPVVQAYQDLIFPGLLIAESSRREN